MIIKEISHKTPKSSGKAKAQAKREERQQLQAIGSMAKAIGSLAVSALGKLSQGGKTARAQDPRPRSVKATIEYALKGDTDVPGELIYSQKLDMLEPEIITIAMESTAAMNQAVKNPCKHFVISWHEDEHPSRAQMTRTISTYLKYAGYEEHQAVAYLHNDTDKTHVHIIANHVHPETFKAVHRDFIVGKNNYKIRERIARRLEIENGWRQVEGKLHKLDSGGKLVERTYEEKILFSQEHSARRVSDKSQRQERHTGKPSFERWCKLSKESSHLRTDIKKIISGKNVNWNDIHKTLEKYNIAIRVDKHGKGLVVFDKYDPDKRCMAASGLSRDLSAGNLGKVINTPYMLFVPPAQSDQRGALQPLPTKPLPSKPAVQPVPVAAVEQAPPPATTTITARPEAIARQYADHASQIAATDPAKAKALKAAALILLKLPNARDITLPKPVLSLDEIVAAMKGMGGRGR